VRRLLAFLLAAVALVTLVACGGGDGDNAEGTTPAAEEDGDDDASEDEAADGEGSPEGIEGVEAYDIDDNSHTEGFVEYDQSPPVGGPHNPVWANCDFYSSEVPSENAVHALEHGAVWIT
jgi:hypothetical protein